MAFSFKLSNVRIPFDFSFNNCLLNGLLDKKRILDKKLCRLFNRAINARHNLRFLSHWQEDIPLFEIAVVSTENT